MLDVLELLAGEGDRFHTSVCFTYGLDLQLYDGLIRRALARSGVSNQLVFCDFNCHTAEIGSAVTARYLGRSYSVIPVRQSGAFHPKAYLLLGQRHGRVLVGSGNVSVGGFFRNAEVFGVFDFNGSDGALPHPVFPQLFEFGSDLGRAAGPIVGRQLNAARHQATWLSGPTQGDGRELLIGRPGGPSLLEEILRRLPAQPDDAVICGSSFDRRLAGAKSFAKASRKPPTFIVQKDTVQLDGRAVKTLGPAAIWKPFVDPYPREKTRRSDARAHAKVWIFRHRDGETCAFGSANPSVQALSAVNTEMMVVMPVASSGTFTKALGFDDCLAERSIAGTLSACEWQEQEQDDEAANELWVTAVDLIQDRAVVTVDAGQVPPLARLALSRAPGLEPDFRGDLSESGGRWQVEVSSLEARVLFARIESAAQVALSNWIAVTWPSVAVASRSGSLSAKIAAGMAAIHAGAIPGSIIFEFLDRFRDFEIVRVAARNLGQRPSMELSASAGPERSAEFFYTDKVESPEEAIRFGGDRTDLDILASLVQPMGLPASESDLEEDFDGAGLEEEIEQRPGKPVEQHEPASRDKRQDPSEEREAYERARRRLEGRLARSAAAIESGLDYLDKGLLVPSELIARQLWMIQIGAYLAGRRVQLLDGNDFICLDEFRFAAYVLSLARCLAGSKRGGLLDKVPASAWDTADGETLKRGIAFLRTAIIWATDCALKYFAEPAALDDFKVSVGAEFPELVAARALARTARTCSECDVNDLGRRFPAAAGVKIGRPSSQQPWATWVRLVSSLEAGDLADQLGTEGQVEGLRRGAVVFQPNLGVTVLRKDAGPRDFRLVDLSKPSGQGKYAAMVRPVLIDGRPVRLEGWPAVEQ